MFIDRDGVINRVIVKDGRPLAPLSIKEFKVLPGVGRAIKSLRGAGFKVIVVTNQPNVGAGKQNRSTVEAMNKKIRDRFRLDGVEVCYHTDSDRCDCRKPKPGMLVRAAIKASIDLKSSFMVGDRWRDIEAGKAAGCKTVLIESRYKEKKAKDPDAVANSLFEASRLILSGSVPAKKNKK